MSGLGERCWRIRLEFETDLVMRAPIKEEADGSGETLMGALER